MVGAWEFPDDVFYEKKSLKSYALDNKLGIGEFSLSLSPQLFETAN